MEYTVSQLARLSGVSTRTLRYYDEIGLLSPARAGSNNYRVYRKEQVDTLQQILFYRTLGVSLDEIGSLLGSPDYDKERALLGHLSELRKRRGQIDLLIENVRKTIASLRGEGVMSDTERFEGFKQRLIDENERKYGSEARRNYGDAVVDAANAKLKGMTSEQYASVEALTERLNEALLEAVQSGDPGGDVAQRACALHKEWLCRYWPDGAYSAEAHRALAQGYVDDERFRAHYEKIAPGCAVFLRDAVNIFCGG